MILCLIDTGRKLNVLCALNLRYFGISRFSLYFSRVERFVICSLKISFTKLGLMSLRVLKFSKHKHCVKSVQIHGPEKTPYLDTFHAESTIVVNINSSFPDFFDNSYEIL